jgi:hypothetical protein
LGAGGRMDSYVLEEKIYVYFQCLTRDAWGVEVITTRVIDPGNHFGGGRT